MPAPIAFENRDTLLDGLLAARREVVFLVGAPLTAPERGRNLGVPDVAGMVSRIRARIAAQTSPRILKRFDEAAPAGAANLYQAAFGFLTANLGQDDANAAVPDATDAARAVGKLGQVVLLVDEADALAEPGHAFDKGFFDVLRALGQDGKLQWVSASDGDLFDLFLTTGLTSAFLNDARKIHVGAMARAEAEAFLREYVKDAFRVGWAWEVAGGLLPALKWLGPKLAAGEAEPGAMEKGLGVWIKPLFQQWWGRLGEGERALLKSGAGEGVRVDKLTDAERRAASGPTPGGQRAPGRGGGTLRPRGPDLESIRARCRRIRSSADSPPRPRPWASAKRARPTSTPDASRSSSPPWMRERA